MRGHVLGQVIGGLQREVDGSATHCDSGTSGVNTDLPNSSKHRRLHNFGRTKPFNVHTKLCTFSAKNGGHTLQAQDDGHTLQAEDDGHTLQAQDDGHTLQAQDEGHTLLAQEDGHKLQAEGG